MMDNQNEGDFTPEELAVLEEPAESIEMGEGEGEGPEQSGPDPEESPEVSAEGEEEASEEQSSEAADQEDAGEQGQPPKGFVPHAALHEERERRKVAEQQVARFNEILARMQQQPQPEQQQPEEPQAPDINEDPLGAVMHEINQLKTQKEQDEQQKQVAQFERHYIGQLTERGRADPTFQGAVDHLFNNTVLAYMEQGASEQQARQLTMRDAYQIAAQAHNAGIDIGQQFYGLAYANGYQPQPSPSPADQQGQSEESQAAQDKLETIRKGQESNKTLTGKGGGSPEPMTLQKLTSLSDDEFDKWVTKNPKEWERLAGAV